MVKDWEHVCLGNLGTFSKGRGINKNSAHSGTISCVRYGELYTVHNDYIKRYYSHISKQVASNSVLLKRGDILFAGSGETKEEIGKCAAFIDDRRTYAGGDIVIFSPTRNVNSKFLGFLLNTPDIAIQKASKGQGDAIVHISATALASIAFLLPPLEEQNAIAEVLSDTDSLIVSFEKLIAKKKAIKQGAMQELLTGKKRLPGFSGEWKISQLQHFLEFEVGYPFQSEFFNQDGYGIRLVKNRDLKSDDQIYFTTENYNLTYLVQQGDILVGMDGDFLPCEWNKGSAVLNQRVGRIKTKSNLNQKFAYYILFDALMELQYGTGATTVKHLSHSIIESLCLFIPMDVNEQAAIATILSDMDAETEQLEKKAAKYRFIKQGMMQELLTGRIRLIDTEIKPEKAPKGHSEKYDDAIAISAIVNVFYDERFYLGRVKVQKLLYLLRRKQEADVSGFKKKAAVPYNEQVRYNGGESIAVKEGYVARKSSKKGSIFSKGKSIDTALQYAGNIQSDIDWLHQKFKYYNTNKETNNLEVLATVDMAVCELEKSNTIVTLDAVKDVIRSNKEWAPKLEKPFFTDAAIKHAITESKELFA